MENRVVKVRAGDLQTGSQLSSGEVVVRVVRKSVRLPAGKVWLRLKKSDGSEREVEWNANTNLAVTPRE